MYPAPSRTGLWPSWHKMGFRTLSLIHAAVKLLAFLPPRACPQKKNSAGCPAESIKLYPERFGDDDQENEQDQDGTCRCPRVAVSTYNSTHVKPSFNVGYDSLYAFLPFKTGLMPKMGDFCLKQKQIETLFSKKRYNLPEGCTPMRKGGRSKKKKRFMFNRDMDSL